MSREDIEVVRAMFTAWEKGDVEAMLEHVAEHVEWNPSLWSGAGRRGDRSSPTGPAAR